MKSLPILKGDKAVYEEMIAIGCPMTIHAFNKIVEQADAFIHVNTEEAEDSVSFVNYEKLVDWLNNPKYKEDY